MRPAVVVVTLLALLSGAGDASAQRSGVVLDLVNANVQKHANGVLGILGISVIPSETASTLSFNSGGKSNGYDFQATQFGGAFTISESFPLYLEGFIGGARYDPVFVFSDGQERQAVPLKWTSFAATGGVGWDFKATDELTLRPIFNFSLGHVESDLSLLGRFVSAKLGPELNFLDGGRLNAYGLGGSFMVDYARYRESYEFDSEWRASWIRLKSFESSDGVRGEAVASTIGTWNRLRVPTGLLVMRRPLRAVGELSFSYLPGDQGEALNTRWLGQIGAGVELDFSDTWVPISRGRIMARYAQGDHLTGFAIGVAASF